ncbi:hypothetical protein ZIOFF_057097 [Zingiber officinale]|uniref:DUF4220 domain-containing protein n=1 Tax=Zingiber officinale TaxID=94328 RepID=A0A8J5KQS7_ZINOF|nr:hypothetical protein ZIOFF_057097 [Zingiber officinale]
MQAKTKIVSLLARHVAGHVASVQELANHLASMQATTWLAVLASLASLAQTRQFVGQYASQNQGRQLACTPRGRPRGKCARACKPLGKHASHNVACLKPTASHVVACWHIEANSKHASHNVACCACKSCKPCTGKIILISFSLFRKRNSNKALSLLLCLSYLGADNIAIFALGNLLNQQNGAVEANASGDIMAFWAPFLLHFGGPDTITSYSLEDNELWLHHLIVEVVIAIAVFLESLPSPHVWKSAIVIFVAGILKYGERMLSLRSASMDHLRESMLSEADPGPNYAKFMQELHSCKEAGVKVEMKIDKEPPPTLPQQEVEEISMAAVISMGYHFFQIFKRLTVDLMLSFQDRIESQNFFLRLKPEQAFQVVEVELSFLHDILNTKAVHVHNTRGRITRVASLSMAILALLLFYHRSGKHSSTFKGVDVLITYLLLLVAIGLEIIAILLLIFSDWAIVALQMSTSGRLEHPGLRTSRKSLGRPNGATPPSSSEKDSSADYNHTNLDRMLELIKLKGVRNRLWYVRSIQVEDVIKRNIFGQLKTKALSTDDLAENYKRLRACRGEWVLREKGYTTIKWSVEKEFDESILIWHIATHLCYQQFKPTDNTEDPNKQMILRRSQDHSTNEVGDEKESGDVEDVENEAGSSEPFAVGGKIKIEDYVKISREISDYLIYLVVYQPKLLPAGIGTNRFLDTCAEAKKFFSDKETEMREELRNGKSVEDEKKSFLLGFLVSLVSTIKKSIFRILGFLFIRPIGTERVLALKKITETIREWWTTITKMMLPKKIRQFFYFCIEVVKEMQQKNKLATQEKIEELGCEKLMEVRTTVNPIDVKGNRSKSVLFDAVKLARQIMKNFKNENKEEEQKNKKKVEEEEEEEEGGENKKEKKRWEVISSVWMEMLCYAAGNCASNVHARQLSQGGELLTHVWLLMMHMGMGEQYQIEAGHARAKLLVGT